MSYDGEIVQISHDIKPWMIDYMYVYILPPEVGMLVSVYHREMSIHQLLHYVVWNHERTLHCNTHTHTHTHRQTDRRVWEGGGDRIKK